MSRGQRDKLREKLKGKAGVDTIIELTEQRQDNSRVKLHLKQRSAAEYNQDMSFN